MINKIGAVSGVNEFVGVKKVDDSTGVTKTSFEDVLGGLLNKVNEAQVKSENSIEAFVRGDSNITMHKVMLDVKEGQMALEMATTLRNHVVELYQEINRLQL